MSVSSNSSGEEEEEMSVNKLKSDPPPKLDVSLTKGTSFLTWRELWNDYSLVNDLEEIDAKKKVALLRLNMVPETVEVVNNLCLSEADKAIPDKILDALEKHILGRVNVTMENRNFRKRCQEKNEAFDDFLVSLRQLATTCEFCNDNCRNRAIRDQIVEGHNDQDVVKQLLQVPKLTLDKTIEVCRALESAKQKASSLQEISKVNVVKSSYKKNKKQGQVRGKNVAQHASSSVSPCSRCGHAVHTTANGECPAAKTQCRKCDRVGHYKIMCRSSLAMSNKRPKLNKGQSSNKKICKLGAFRINRARSGSDEEPAPTVRSQVHEDNLHIQEVKQHIDSEYKSLKELIMSGFPNNRDQVPESLRKFWKIKEHLSVDQELIVYGCRLFIPVSLRNVILERLHESHQGIIRTQSRARLSVYWPGIDKDIQYLVESCKFCQQCLPSNVKEPMVSKVRPSRPFQEVAADFAYYGGQNFLITVDCYSDWPEITIMNKDTSAEALIRAIRSLFCRTSAADVLWSDNGTQFTSAKFQRFLKEWKVIHKTSSPHYSQSNGKVEATVKSMKKLIASSWTGRSVDVDKLCRALLQYRNTPSRRDNKSPAYKLFGHPIQDSVPAHRRSFAGEWQSVTENVTSEHKATKSLEQSENYYNRNAHHLSDIVVGNRVAIQNHVTKAWDIYGVVTEVNANRKYHVRTNSGRVLVRNRRFLKKRTSVSVPNHSNARSGKPDSKSVLRKSGRTIRKPKRFVEEF